MNINTKRALLSAAGLLLSAGNALASATNTSSTDIVGNLGFFSTIAGTIIIYAKYIAFFIAILSLFALWSSGQLAKFSRKVEGAVNAKEGVKVWLIEAVLVIVAFIVLFSFIIPIINTYVPGTL
jgi:F0F1-type ATP synthase assembly protein I